MKDIIINLVGASGSGKTTIAKQLEEQGYNIIHSFTTRDPREENEWGHTFISPKEYEEFSEVHEFPSYKFRTYHENLMIAYWFGYGNHYFATTEQYKGKGVSIYVVNPEGAEMVHDQIGGFDRVVTIYISVDRAIRELRLEDSGRCKEDNVIRLDKDDYEFKTCKCNYVVSGNGAISDTIQMIRAIIENER